ncbi:MAG: Crp/Fnr family transcriptional regulator [Thermoleophilaceae bacterium]|jgi:CRP/FNR family transcriptional regulator|nr:Crp/Fnr family transcriptional regulator [Thermoleophilaceae bacterium]
MADGEETSSLLRRVPLFAGLESGAIEDLAAMAVPRFYADGEVVFREGDTGDTCFVIRDGAVRVTRARAFDGQAITLAELRFGEPFGELAMFGGETRSATVEALEDTRAVALLAADMKRLLAAHPEVSLSMLSVLAARVRAANEMATRQRFQTVAGRVAGALIALRQSREPDGADGNGETVIAATQSDIAQLAGSSRESASRFLASLEREGIVTCGRGKVTVHDPSALQGYIH